jgi:hypothetical protein
MKKLLKKICLVKIFFSFMRAGSRRTHAGARVPAGSTRMT